MAARLALLVLCAIAGASAFKKVCYYDVATASRPDRAVLKPEELDPKQCTHIVYCFAKVTRGGRLQLPTVPRPLRRTFNINKFVQTLKAKNPSVKVLLGVKADSPQFALIVKRAKKQFINQLRGLLRQNNLDGVDFFTHDLKRGNNINIIRDLRWHLTLWRQLKTILRNKLITATYHPVTLLGNFHLSDVTVKIIEVLDMLNFATYDLHAPNWRKLLHHTSLELLQDVMDTLDYVLTIYGKKEIAFSKLTFGFATFGRTYKLKSPDLHLIGNASAGRGDAGHFTQEKGLLSTFEMCPLLSGASMSKARQRSVPYMYNKKIWISYDDMQSMRKKLHLCHKMKFGGISLFSLDLDDTKDMCRYSKDVPVRQHLMTLDALLKASERLEGSNVTDTRPIPVKNTTSHQNKTVLEDDEDDDNDEYTNGEDENKKNDNTEKVNICYYNVKAQKRQGIGFFTPKMIDTSLCSHVVVGLAFLSPKNKWTVTIDRKIMHELKVLKRRKPELKIMLSVTGHLDTMFASKKISKEVIRNLIQFVKINRLDGIDIFAKVLDLTDPSPLPRLTNFLRQLKTQLVLKVKWQTTVITTISAKNKMLKFVSELKELSETVEWINFAAYDFVTYKDGKTGHSSPMNKIRANMKGLINKGLPASKMVLGIASYGRTYKLADGNKTKPGSPVTGPGEKGEGTNTPGSLAIYEICKLNMTKIRDIIAGVPYGLFDDREWISFDDFGTLRRKVDFALRNQMRGVFLWSVDRDDFSGRCGFGKFPFLSIIRSRIAANKLRMLNDSENELTRNPIRQQPDRESPLEVRRRKSEPIRHEQRRDIWENTPTLLPIRHQVGRVYECQARGWWSLLPVSDMICRAVCEGKPCLTSYCLCY